MSSHKNFVFSSVGDNTNFAELWITKEDSKVVMNYDIYVIYYGNNDEIYNKIGLSTKEINHLKNKGII